MPPAESRLWDQNRQPTQHSASLRWAILLSSREAGLRQPIGAALSQPKRCLRRWKEQVPSKTQVRGRPRQRQSCT